MEGSEETEPSASHLVHAAIYANTMRASVFGVNRLIFVMRYRDPEIMTKCPITPAYTGIDRSAGWVDTFAACGTGAASGWVKIGGIREVDMGTYSVYNLF